MIWNEFWNWGQSEPKEAQKDKSTASQDAVPANPISWSGRFPMRRGGTVVFTINLTSSFNIAILSAADVEGALLSSFHVQ
jgi:hypothetical protein